MLLKSDDGKEFELAIIQDRLPEVHDGHGDDEIATVSFRVATDDVEWEETSPMLATHELHALAEWLEAVSRGGDAGEAEIDLLGPGLNFQIVKATPGQTRLRVKFFLADRPEEFDVDAETTEAKHIDLKLDSESLASAAAQLRKDLEDFASAPKDDITGEEDLGMISSPDPTLGLVDGESAEPPGAGDGEDNAGNR